jgi:hypothetical protein
MKAQLCDFQALVIARATDAVDHPIFMRNPTRPPTREVTPQRFRFAYALEGRALALLDKFVDPITNLGIIVSPIQIIFPRFVRKNQFQSSNSRVCPPSPSSWLMADRKRDALRGFDNK